MSHITLSMLEAALRKQAHERPENRYRRSAAKLFDAAGCFYGRGVCDDGSVGCIFGQAFRELGVDPQELDRALWDGEMAGTSIRYALEQLGLLDRTPYEIIDKFNSLQMAQDRGESWGACIEYLDQ